MHSTGHVPAAVSIIDRAYSELFKKLTSLRGAIKKQVCRYTIEDAVATLEEYVEVYFREEERQMKQYGYPAYPLHKGKHEQFAEEVRYLRDELDNIRTLGLKGSYELSVETVRVITDWIRDHIMTDDRALGEFLMQYPDIGSRGLFPACRVEEHIKGGILTICSHCLRIRSNKGLWRQKEPSMDLPGGIAYSHGICPECVQDHYADLFAEKR